jgi:uncharacterized protein DUF1579
VPLLALRPLGHGGRHGRVAPRRHPLLRSTARVLSILLLGALPLTARAQSPQPARPDTSRAQSQPKPTRPCDAPEAHQFDFWIGDWEVRTPDGKVAGTNRVEPVLGGCAIQEHWTGSRGMSGTSLNMFDPATRRWHQTWVDDHGTLLLLDGAYTDGSMVLTGQTPPGPGSTAPMRQRITWSRLEGGDVRQLWEQSADGGATWKVIFDGHYHHKK